ncbi:hypothetical protein HQ489_00330 [Candidatus Woesearchaeota archaeon]|nr:hypothetical protein [Candidatus Woesearchaeota archaeon]
MSEIENDIKKFFNDNISEIKELETSFHAYTGLKLHFERIILEYMNNTFTLTNLLIVQFQSIDKAIQKNEANKVAHLLSSIERMSNQILRFIDLLNQLNQKVDKFENESYYPSEKTYGRIMSSKEFRNMKSTGLLSSDKNPTPVFDATPAVIDRIDSMSTDRRSTYFQEIGVRSTDNIVYFRTKLKPVVGPVPQSNGLREYKFPKGIPVEFLKAA